MKKNNSTLKDAFREAAQLELDTLPKENQIIRPYSQKFQSDMNDMLGVGTPAETRKRPRVKIAALIAAVLVIVLSASTAFANNVIRVGGPEMIEMLQAQLDKATYSEDIPEFDEAFAKADDYFANLTRETEGACPLLLDYSEVYELDITAEKDGYKFYIDKIVKGKYKHNKCISGNIFKGNAVYQWVVEDGYFLITEITRADGEKWDAEKDPCFELSTVVAGYNPWCSRMCLRGKYGISECEKYGWMNIVNVTDLMKFANHDLGLVVEEYPYSGDLMSDESASIGEDGLPAFRDNVEGTNLVVKFNIDKKFADEKAAEAYAEENGWNIGLDLYKK